MVKSLLYPLQSYLHIMALSGQQVLNTATNKTEPLSGDQQGSHTTQHSIHPQATESETGYTVSLLSDGQCQTPRDAADTAVSVSQLPSTAPHSYTSTHTEWHTSQSVSSESDFIFSCKLQSPGKQSPTTLDSSGSQSPTIIQFPTTLRLSSTQGLQVDSRVPSNQPSAESAAMEPSAESDSSTQPPNSEGHSDDDDMSDESVNEELDRPPGSMPTFRLRKSLKLSLKKCTSMDHSSIVSSSAESEERDTETSEYALSTADSADSELGSSNDSDASGSSKTSCDEPISSRIRGKRARTPTMNCDGPISQRLRKRKSLLQSFVFDSHSDSSNDDQLLERDTDSAMKCAPDRPVTTDQLSSNDELWEHSQQSDCSSESSGHTDASQEDV